MKRVDGYAPLSAYGMLGDGHAGALVAADGAIDWFATPRLDAPPVCAALLDPREGGAFELQPAAMHAVSHRYLPGTLVYETTFSCTTGTVRVTDSLNRGAGGPLPWTELARRIEGISGQVLMRWTVRPGHQLTRARPWARWPRGLPRIDIGDVQLAIIEDDMAPELVDESAFGGEIVIRSRDRRLLGVVASRKAPWIPEAASVQARIDSTADHWRRWSRGIRYHGPHARNVHRSALLLKGLIQLPESGISSALTTSLPERPGGELNFDYRFGWVRDAAFALDAMNRIGLEEDKHAALSWLLRAVANTAPEVRPLYTLAGAPAPSQMRRLDFVPGYRRSWPVHVGNAAAAQIQLGAYGEIMDTVWRHIDHGGLLDATSAEALARVADRVCDSWRMEDAGIWELETHAHYTISKMHCWVALDRALRLAELGELASARAERWRAERAAIRSWVDQHCWSSTKRSYTFHSGTDEVDAAVLLAARTGYLAPDDSGLLSTVETIQAELTAGGPLLFRYSGASAREGAFLPCTFWLVEALATAGRQESAEALFEQALEHAGDSGLYSEEIDPRTGELLGNIPQALTHLALISAATALWPRS